MISDIITSESCRGKSCSATGCQGSSSKRFKSFDSKASWRSVTSLRSNFWRCGKDAIHSTTLLSRGPKQREYRWIYKCKVKLDETVTYYRSRGGRRQLFEFEPLRFPSPKRMDFIQCWRPGLLLRLCQQVCLLRHLTMMWHGHNRLVWPVRHFASCLHIFLKNRRLLCILGYSGFLIFEAFDSRDIVNLPWKRVWTSSFQCGKLLVLTLFISLPPFY